MGARSPGRLDWLWPWVPSTRDNLCCSVCTTPLLEPPCPFLALSCVTDRHQCPSGDRPNKLVPCPQGTVWGTRMHMHGGSHRPWGRQGLDPVHGRTGRGHPGTGRGHRGKKRAMPWVAGEPAWGASGAQMGEVGGGACRGAAGGWAAPPAPHPLCCTTPPYHGRGAPPNRQPTALAPSIQRSGQVDPPAGGG